MRYLYALPLIISLLLPPSVHAALNGDIKTDAIKCSGLWFIFTTLPIENSTFPSLSSLMSLIYAVHEGERQGDSLTNGQISEAKDAAAMELVQLHSQNPDALTELFRQCNSWREVIASILSEKGLLTKGTTNAEFEAAFLAMPKHPSSRKYSKEEKFKIQVFVDSAFLAWKDMDYMTLRKTMSKLKEEVSK